MTRRHDPGCTHLPGRPPASARLVRAYRNTDYAAGGVDVAIGRRSIAMDRLLSAHGAREAAFVTAYNPYSRAMPAGWNRRMQTRLAQALRRHKLLPATGSWRRWSEAHFLVFADARFCRVLLRRFRQNALVIVRQGRPVRLLWI